MARNGGHELAAVPTRMRAEPHLDISAIAEVMPCPACQLAIKMQQVHPLDGKRRPRDNLAFMWASHKHAKIINRCQHMVHSLVAPASWPSCPRRPARQHTLRLSYASSWLISRLSIRR